MLKIVLVETVKHYWFLKIFILEYICLNILWDELRNIHKIILLCNKVLWQSLFLDCVIIWVPSQIPFLLKSTTDRQTLITFVDIFPKTNQGSLSLQEKQLDNICCQWSNLAVEAKMRIVENLYPTLWDWQLPHI